jgi:hypothetical protein
MINSVIDTLNVIAGQARAQMQQMVQSMVRSGMAAEQVALVTGMAIDVVEGYIELRNE